MLRKLKCFLRIHKWIWRCYYLDGKAYDTFIICKHCGKKKYKYRADEPIGLGLKILTIREWPYVESKARLKGWSVDSGETQL